MKKFFSGLFWIALYLAGGLAAGVSAAALVRRETHRLDHATALHLVLCGEVAGLLLFILAARRRWLPGLRPPRLVLPWGAMQAVWLAAGFLAMQLVGALCCSLLIGLTIGLVTVARDAAAHVPFRPVHPHQLVAPAVAGYLTAALWSVWYIRRRGPALLHDPSARGIAWAPAARPYYLTAALLAGLITMVVIVMFQIAPPDPAAVQDLPEVKAFGRPGWPMAILLVLALFVAPPVEEWIFRGGIFSALASRLSPLWAGVITTVLFMAAHYPEKIHYPLGFIDVGMMAGCAAWLRVRAGSIRPGILLHMLYNLGAVAAAALAH